MNEKKIRIRELLSAINRSELHRQIIPLGLAAGWPSIRRMGETLCVTIPYFNRQLTDQGVLLYSIYCSITVPVHNPSKLMDLTIYPYQQNWADIPYGQPVGRFPHPALEGVDRKEYRKLCEQLYDYYDLMLDAVAHHESFKQQAEMAELFSRLMEPDLYPQYLRINKRFFSTFCNQGDGV